MREYFRSEYIRPVLRFLIRIIIAVGVILLFSVIGLWVFLSSRGQMTFHSFIELLTLILLVEGSVIGAAGGFMFVGYSEYRLFGQAAINPIIASDQRQKWRERRFSQQKLGLAMLIAGVLLIFLGLLASFATSL